MLFENTFTFRKRVAAISAFYLVYFVLSIVALVRIGQKDYSFGLVVPIVTATLHFVFALAGMAMNDNTAMKSNVAKLVLVFDWAQAFALGIASSSISRDDLSKEVGWAVTANVPADPGRSWSARPRRPICSTRGFSIKTTGEYLG